METIASVGIDIGTTTTQILFSYLSLSNVANALRIPNIEICYKEKFYQSPIYITPIYNDEINESNLLEILDTEYKKAASLGFDTKSIKSGAVVITGQSSRKDRAQQIINTISNLAGEFVVAAAGANLEAILAGFGSGAMQYSKDHHLTVANIDIGGGTTNIAIFTNGNIVDATSLEIGGNLVYQDDNKELRFRTDLFAKYAGVEETYEKVAANMAGIIFKSINSSSNKNDILPFITKDCSPLNLDNYTIDAISFSGGVARSIYLQDENTKMFNDIGPYLGHAVANNKEFSNYKIYIPQNVNTATVAGAGMYVTELSGSTIAYNEDIFPMHDIPIIKFTEQDALDFPSFSRVIKNRIDWYNQDHSDKNPIAIAFDGIKNPSYKDITLLAKAIIDGCISAVKKQLPIIVVLKHDMGKVLGQAMNRLCPGHTIISLDGIKLKQGDYIDMGKPLAKGMVIPVVVKTLIFGN